MFMRRWPSLRALACHFTGAVLVLAGIGLVAMTARGMIHYHTIAGSHGGEMMDLGADGSLQPGQHGYMVRLVGIPTVVEAPHDPEFNLRVNTPLLVRHVEMFQWREVRIGTGVHYEQDWVDRWLDARHFREPARHANPGDGLPISNRPFEAGRVQMGGFTLSPALVQALPGSGDVTPDPQSLPANLAASFSQYQDYLVTSAHPDSPRLGDVRVSWTEVPLREMTIVARVDGDHLVAASDAADGKGYNVAVGDVSLLDMFPDLPVPPEFVPSKCIIAVLLAALGAFLLLSDRRVEPDFDGVELAGIDSVKRSLWRCEVFGRDALLALGVGALTVGVVASVLWLGNDTPAMFCWLLFTMLGLVLTIWRLRRAR